MMNNLGLGFLFTARDLASSKMARLQHQFQSLDERVTGGTERMTTAFRQLGIGLAVFTAGAVAVAGAFTLAGAAGKFEQGLAAIGAVTRATTRELQMLRDASIQAGIETQFSPDEAVAGLQSLATAGQTAEQATRTLVPVLDLAAGSLGQLGVAQAAEAVVGTLNAYGIAAGEAAGVTDRLLRITQLTNFQTRDFESGLAKAAATGAVFNQGLDDVLITMGLLRNRNIDASSAATAFREASRRLASDQRSQQAILGTGVQVFDKVSGQMRSMVDVMTDFAGATRNLSEEERNRNVVQAFGARGLLAFNAVMNAAFTTMQDGVEVTLHGADAIEALRNEMSRAEGTAESFRERLLDTFEGQKTLLRGTMQTFAVVLGEPFAKVFKPIVAAVVDALNFLLRAFQVIPAPLRNIFAGLVVAGGAFLMLVGGVIAAKASIALLAIAFKALGITIGGIMATLLPAILIVGALAGVVGGLYIAFQRNLGGIADLARRMQERVSLVFQGLGQLFEQGGFSGAVREELNRAENLGLKRFLISVYQIAHRIRQAWEGFKEGFTTTIDEARPVFEGLVEALSTLGREIAGIFSGLSGGVASLPSSEFRSFAQIVGATIGSLVTWFTRLLRVFAQISAGVAGGFGSMMDVVRPALQVVGEALGNLFVAWRELTGATNDSASAVGDSTKVWIGLGRFLGRVFAGIVVVLSLALGGLIKVLTGIFWVLRMLKEAFVATGVWIGETAARIYIWFSETLPSAISSAVDRVTGFFRAIGQFLAGIGRRFRGIFGEIVDGIVGFLSPVVEFFRGVGRALRDVFNGIHDFVIRLLRRVPDSLLPASLERLKRTPLSTELRTEDEFEAIGRTRVTADRAEAATSAMPAAADVTGRSNDLAQLEQSVLTMAAQARERGEDRPLQVNVQVDGETIARATHQANSDAAARSFSPLPAY